MPDEKDQKKLTLPSSVRIVSLSATQKAALSTGGAKLPQQQPVPKPSKGEGARG